MNSPKCRSHCREKVSFKNRFSNRDQKIDFILCVDRKNSLITEFLIAIRNAVRSAIFLEKARLFAVRRVCGHDRVLKIGFFYPSIHSARTSTFGSLAQLFAQRRYRTCACSVSIAYMSRIACMHCLCAVLS